MLVNLDYHIYILDEYYRFYIHAFFISNTFISNARQASQAKAKQHPETELSLFGNYLLFQSTLSSKNNRRYSKNCTKTKSFSFNKVIRSMTIEMRLKMNNRSQRYDINKLRPRHDHKYTTKNILY